jgi:hypothetical protein
VKLVVHPNAAIVNLASPARAVTAAVVVVQSIKKGRSVSVVLISLARLNLRNNLTPAALPLVPFEV